VGRAAVNPLAALGVAVAPRPAAEVTAARLDGEGLEGGRHPDELALIAGRPAEYDAGASSKHPGLDSNQRPVA
jgi:hypothetical protein